MKKRQTDHGQGGTAFQGEATTFHEAGRNLLKNWQEANVSPCSERREGIRNEVGKRSRGVACKDLSAIVKSLDLILNVVGSLCQIFELC